MPWKMIAPAVPVQPSLPWLPPKLWERRKGYSSITTPVMILCPMIVSWDTQAFCTDVWKSGFEGVDTAWFGIACISYLIVFTLSKIIINLFALPCIFESWSVWILRDMVLVFQPNRLQFCHFLNKNVHSIFSPGKMMVLHFTRFSATCLHSNSRTTGILITLWHFF